MLPSDLSMPVLGSERARFWVTLGNEPRARGEWVDIARWWVSVQWREVLQSRRCVRMVREPWKCECLVARSWRSPLVGVGIVVVGIPAVPVSEGT